MEKNTTMTKASHPDLLKSPHIMSELTDFITREWRPDAPELERLAQHLMTCSYCRTSLIVLLSGEQDWRKEGYSSEEAIRHLMMQFVTIHRELEVQNDEELGAYAEMIILKGKEEANRNFSQLAEHVARCPRCRSMVEEMLNFLRESEMSV